MLLSHKGRAGVWTCSALVVGVRVGLGGGGRGICMSQRAFSVERVLELLVRHCGQRRVWDLSLSRMGRVDCWGGCAGRGSQY